MPAKKQQIRMIFKLAAFGAFIMLGWLGIRNYKASVEKVKINACIEELSEIVMNVQDRFSNGNYAGFDYKRAVSLSIFPKRMFKPGYREAINAYLGGVDVFASSLSHNLPDRAWEISFQGLSQTGCMELLRLNMSKDSVIAVAGYGKPMPSGVLDEIYIETKQEDIKPRNVFKGDVAPFMDDYRVKEICNCEEDYCSVVWKFR